MSVTADTYVMTVDGPRQVEDLVGVATDFLVNGTPYSTQGFSNVGTQPVYSLNTENGYSVKITDDTKVTLFNGAKRTVGQLNTSSRIAVHDHGVVEWTGIPDTSNWKFHKGIPSVVEKESSAFYVEFLKGLFSADILLQMQPSEGINVYLTQSVGHPSNINVVQRMLLRLGIYSSINAQSDLVIANESLFKLNDRIRLYHPKKIAELDVALTTQLRNLLPSDNFDTNFVSLTYLGDEDVYDCQVLGPNAFDANGIHISN